MGKSASDGILDGTLDAIASCTTLTICAGQPTSYAQIATFALASIVIDSGDFSKANGDVDGRKVTVAGQADLDIDTSGDADHVVVDDGTDFMVTTVTTQALTSGGTVSTNDFDFENGDPV
ncbi:MAG: hypothetical protein Tp1111SUR522732_25 [Prokaryotic dsDNA virus sp.]|jgi:hypothetical protein|uniref:hypothetical protein n=1 Tax=Methylophaga sp. UBA2689 TaxID=1946878 RepID=UPI001189E6FC|nr:hypothetical protein [Methylophaga sp. UBA2689]QDP47087.1 MAG: hypothetical protein Tp1111SUR522732_25 [Prokaryotic dsDNA virus sp.]|tara:strand:- start:18459 stop:18818 length:360 start_codon:yes stop_codon:yes gene_type:complete